MMMKMIIKAGLLPAAAALALASCSRQPFMPLDSPNPWPDEYGALGSMAKCAEWGPYNVHDPFIRKFGDTYYAYSTDAVWMAPRDGGDTIAGAEYPAGYVQMRASKDLVRWDFVGWAFSKVPQEAWDYVYPISGDRTSRGLWAPAVCREGDTYRMYYCLSTFGSRVSCIGLAESSSPIGPWVPKGIAVRSSDSTAVNCIDPTIIEDAGSGRLWMVYGSFFGGIYAVELSHETGLPMREGDLGQMIAHRAGWQTENMEAPEVIFNPATGKYYLFSSYGPLFTTYNVRVCMADSPEGPYSDYLGVDPRGEVNTFPVLTGAYRFLNHMGWQGVGHCTCFQDGDGNYFLASQGRPSSNPGMMDLCVRRMFFRADGWPMVSPERYAGEPLESLDKQQIYGEYEIIRIMDNFQESDHEPRADGQADALLESEVNKPEIVSIDGGNALNYSGGSFTLRLNGQDIDGVMAFMGHDWENEKQTVLLTGIDNQGFAVWGKKIR